MQSEMTDRDSIGLQQGVVALCPYTIAWKRLFEEERATLKASLGDQILDIQHIGSTSIPGMVAKPILDIAIAVNDFEEARACIAPIEGLGYEYRGELGMPRRHYFVKGDPRTHHIHMVEINSQDWVNQLLFRDYLTRHPHSAQAYADLKIELAGRFPKDREAYLEAKAPFIQKILELASSGF
jgi:GrpB-like predicted nucleotidyltransferase (UPF0157 family)